MPKKIKNYNPAKGKDERSKYPFVGAAYNKYGEQPGFVYDPYQDAYFPDPKSVEQVQKAQGTYKEPPKKPGLTDLVVPVAAIGGGYALTQGLGSKAAGALGGLFSSTTPVEELANLKAKMAIDALNTQASTELAALKGGASATSTGAGTGVGTGGGFGGSEGASAMFGGEPATASMLNPGMMSYLGPLAVAATPMLGKMIGSKFMPHNTDYIQRPMDNQSLLNDNILNSSFQGFDSLSPDQKLDIVNRLMAAGKAGAPGLPAVGANLSKSTGKVSSFEYNDPILHVLAARGFDNQQMADARAMSPIERYNSFGHLLNPEAKKAYGDAYGAIAPMLPAQTAVRSNPGPQSSGWGINPNTVNHMPGQPPQMGGLVQAQKPVQAPKAPAGLPTTNHVSPQLAGGQKIINYGDPNNLSQLPPQLGGLVNPHGARGVAPIPQGGMSAQMPRGGTITLTPEEYNRLIQMRG